MEIALTFFSLNGLYAPRAIYWNNTCSSACRMPPQCTINTIIGHRCQCDSYASFIFKAHHVYSCSLFLYSISLICDNLIVTCSSSVSTEYLHSTYSVSRYNFQNPNKSGVHSWSRSNFRFVCNRHISFFSFLFLNVCTLVAGCAHTSIHCKLKPNKLAKVFTQTLYVHFIWNSEWILSSFLVFRFAVQYSRRSNSAHFPSLYATRILSSNLTVDEVITVDSAVSIEYAFTKLIWHSHRVQKI